MTAVGGLTKTKSIRLWLWSSVGLKVVRTNGKAPLLFANVQNRDEAFNLILAVCSEGMSGGRTPFVSHADSLSLVVTGR